MDAEEVLTEFLMNWEIDDYGTNHTVRRMIEHLEWAGFRIVRTSDPEQQIGMTDVVRSC